MAENPEIDASDSRRQMVLVAIGVLLVGAILSFVYLTFFKTNYVVLFSKLRPADAVAVVAELQKEKTPYRLADKGTTVLVPEDLADASRLNVVSTDIPLKGAVGFELFNKSDMGLTDFAQKINYQRALQGELSRTIMSLNGVDSARVHLSLPEQTIFQRDHTAAKASVTVAMQLGSTLTPSAVNGIQRLVASAVADLGATDVVVLDSQGNVISAAAPALSPPAAPEVQQKLAVAQFYTARIREALQNAGLADQAQVSGVDLLGSVAGPAAPTTASDSEHAGSNTPDDATTSNLIPSSRTFGLRAILTIPPILSENDRAKVIAVARQAIAFDAGKGDDVVFGAPPAAPWAPSQVPAAPMSNHNVATVSDPVPAGPALAQIVAIAAVVAAMAVLLTWLWSSRRLSHARRVAFAARLAQALDTLEQPT